MKNQESLTQANVRSLFALDLKGQFDREVAARSHREDDWITYASWTLPYVYPQQDNASTENMAHDYQSVGAQATNHLTNKIATVLFRPGKPFFRLDLTDAQKEELSGQGYEDDNAIQELLSIAEKKGMKKLAKKKVRTAVLNAIKSLIITGNSLIYMPEKDSASTQVYSLRDYIIIRDMSGNAYKIITRDSHVMSTLPEDIQELVRFNSNKAEIKDNETVTIYTGIEKGANGKYIVWQEIDNLFRVPRKIGEYAEDDLPWIPLTWNLTRGSHYGTGLVEEYSGDFYTYSVLSETLVNLSAIVSDIKVLVDPMGSTDVDQLNDSPSGTYVTGRAEDISYLQLEKALDMQFLLSQMESYARRIGAGFLFNSAVTRDAERVTAEEIRMQANELEGSLGGVYSRLAEDMQQPIAKRAMASVDAGFKGIEPIIITGVESLSRTSELEQMMLFFNDLAALADLPEPAQKRLNWQGVISKLGAARQVEYKTFLLDEETVKQNDQDELDAEANQQAQIKGNKPQEQLL